MSVSLTPSPLRPDSTLSDFGPTSCLGSPLPPTSSGPELHPTLPCKGWGPPTPPPSTYDLPKYQGNLLPNTLHEDLERTLLPQTMSLSDPIRGTSDSCQGLKNSIHVDCGGGSGNVSCTKQSGWWSGMVVGGDPSRFVRSPWVEEDETSGSPEGQLSTPTSPDTGPPLP